MAGTTDFLTLMSSMLYQAVHNPGKPPVVPLDRFPANSREQRILIDLQKTLASIRSSYQIQLTQMEQEGLLYQCVYGSKNYGIIISDIETGRVIEANETVSALHGYPREEFIGLSYLDYIHPDSISLYEHCLKVIKSGEVIREVSVHTCRDGSLMFVDLGMTQSIHNNRSCVMTIVRDLNEINEQILAARKVQQQVNLRTREQSILLEITQALSSTLTLDPDLILAQLHKIVNYTHAGLFMVEKNMLTSLVMVGPQRIEQAVPFQIEIENIQTRHFLFNREDLVNIGDVWSDDPKAILLRYILRDQATILLEGIQSFLWVPLVVKEKVLGGMSIANVVNDYFTPHHIDLVMNVANQAAIAMVNTELYRQAQEYASMQERQRLARNLHDAVNQSLFSASLIAEVLPRIWEKTPEEGRESLLDLQRLTKSAMAEMRIMLTELRPVETDDINFSDLLRLLGDSFTGRTGIPVSVNSVGNFRFPTDVQVAFYRICQESLNNIAKHAVADHAIIYIQNKDDSIELTVRDNGCGFDPDHVSNGRYGLSIMRERAEEVGATLSIQSVPGKGTDINMVWKQGAESRKKNR